MRATSLQCQNCGADLPAPGDAEFVRCTHCRTAHQVERARDGSMNVTMLEAAVKEVHKDVQVVDQKADRLLHIHRAVADKENARLELRRLQDDYQDRSEEWQKRLDGVNNSFRSNWATLRVDQETPMKWAVGFIVLGLLVCAGMIAILVATSDVKNGFMENIRGFLTFVAFVAGVLFPIGIIWVKSMFGKRNELRATHRQTVSDLEAEKRRMEVQMNEAAAALQAIMDKRIEVV